MIFQFSITGRENDITNFERELLEILLRILKNQEMIAHDIHFCVHEAILNIVQHTYKWDLSQILEIKVHSTDTEEKTIIEFYIRDYGDPVKYSIVPPSKISRFQLRKRGLYMISKIMDEFRLEPLEKIGNLTYMKKILILPPNILAKETNHLEE